MPALSQVFLDPLALVRLALLIEVGEERILQLG
jgi:hypothetical protein